jgi:hypothetical protein
VEPMSKPTILSSFIDCFKIKTIELFSPPTCFNYTI